MSLSVSPETSGDLFGEPIENLLEAQEHLDIDGLRYVANFISDSAERELLAAVDAQPWLSDLKRRVQHYGYRYDYKSRKVDPTMYLGPLPDWIQPLAARLVAEGFMAVTPDQVIVNEYLPGQGIAAHVDCLPCFGPVLCSLSLGSQCVMDLTQVEDASKTSLMLERCSLLVLAGDARYLWRHAIAGRKSDKYAGQVFQRGRRVSLTFRSVIGGIGNHKTVAAGFILHEGRVLLARRALTKKIAGGLLHMPGGHLETGETAQAALQRELMEELGVRVQVGELLHTFEYSNNNQKTIGFVYVTTLLDPPSALRFDPADNSEIIWATRDDLETFFPVKADHNYVAAVKGFARLNPVEFSEKVPGFRRSGDEHA